MKEVKVVIGANYGDEGKGLVSRRLAKQMIIDGINPIVVLSNGTAQRGHTVDYNPKNRHVFHHFGSGTGDGIPTYFAETFLVHPMEFRRELCEELLPAHIAPVCYCSPNALVITPFDMMVDHITEDYIAKVNGEREYGSCGFGTWCAVEGRFPLGRTLFTVNDFSKIEMIPFIMEEIWKDCLAVLAQRGVDIETTKFASLLTDRTTLINNFTRDVCFFLKHTHLVDFNAIWTAYSGMVFENGQGLGLDVEVDNDWHTTSHTGLTNPYQMLKDKEDYRAEVVYVSRSYLTRHGVGPLEEKVNKNEINKDMLDKTNVYNKFQGDLKYGYLSDRDQKARIAKDWSIAEGNKYFSKSMAITHLNEFEIDTNAKYISNNPYNLFIQS